MVTSFAPFCAPDTQILVCSLLNGLLARAEELNQSYPGFVWRPAQTAKDSRSMLLSSFEPRNEPVFLPMRIQRRRSVVQ